MGFGQVGYLFSSCLGGCVSQYTVANRTWWEPESKRLKLSCAGFSNSQRANEPCAGGGSPPPCSHEGPGNRQGEVLEQGG